MRAEIRVAAPAEQQSELNDWLARASGGRRAVIAENGFMPLEATDDVAIARLAPGCVCCVGQVPLRVTLTRMLRAQRPDAVLLLLASAEHLSRVRALLADGSLGVKLELE